MKSPKISLIVPCYNVASVCDKFFESLLGQTYDNIEIVCVNDGSTDKTEEKLLYYKEKLECRGFEVKYICQENKGLSGAINTGLKVFTGDFLCWADPDDYFELNSFELRLQYMLEHPDCAIVTSDAYVRNGDKCTVLSNGFPHTYEPNQFELLLKCESIFCSGCHMVRASAFDIANPERDIFEYSRGQNYQLLLPIYYKFERHFLNVPLYNYIVYDNSMSHGKETYQQKIQRSNEHENAIIETLRRIDMPDEDRNRFVEDVQSLCIRMNCGYALRFNSVDDYKKYYNQLKKKHLLCMKDRIKRIIITFGLNPFKRYEN